VSVPATCTRIGTCTPARTAWRRWLRSAGMLASNLYLRANVRATALFTALSARGYTGDLTVLQNRPAWSGRNLGLIAGSGALLLAVALGVRLGWLPSGLPAALPAGLPGGAS
jgi:energy-coupling factor transporter transmembrane protein EcfT